MELLLVEFNQNWIFFLSDFLLAFGLVDLFRTIIFRKPALKRKILLSLVLALCFRLFLFSIYFKGLHPLIILFMFIVTVAISIKILLRLQTWMDACSLGLIYVGIGVLMELMLSLLKDTFSIGCDICDFLLKSVAVLTIILFQTIFGVVIAKLNISRKILKDIFQYSLLSMVFISTIITIKFGLVSYFFHVSDAILAVIEIGLMFLFFVFCMLSLKRIFLVSGKISELKREYGEVMTQNFFLKNDEYILQNLRRFYHNQSNIIAALNGFVHNNDIDSLKNYLQEISDIKIESSPYNIMSVTNIKHSAIVGLILAKYEVAKQKKVDFKLIVNETIEQVNLRAYILIECLGILLDNAIEAAENAEDKYVKVVITESDGFFCEISNSFLKKPNLEEMFKKGSSTKGPLRGNGLWILKQIGEEYKNIHLNTYIGENILQQEFIVR